MKANPLRNQHGFTLVELIVTSTYVAAASAAIIGIFIVIAPLNRESRNLAAATATAEQKIEIYRDAGYAAIPTGTPAEDFTSKLPANLGAPRSAIANVSEPQAGLKQVNIVISYSDGGKTKKVQTSTLMTPRGINR
jgi:type II secretory pathway pseudopilin PulG